MNSILKKFGRKKKERTKPPPMKDIKGGGTPGGGGGAFPFPIMTNEVNHGFVDSIGGITFPTSPSKRNAISAPSSTRRSTNANNGPVEFTILWSRPSFRRKIKVNPVFINEPTEFGEGALVPPDNAHDFDALPRYRSSLYDEDVKLVTDSAESTDSLYRSRSLGAIPTYSKQNHGMNLADVKQRRKDETLANHGERMFGLFQSQDGIDTVGGGDDGDAQQEDSFSSFFLVQKEEGDRIANDFTKRSTFSSFHGEDDDEANRNYRDSGVNLDLDEREHGREESYDIIGSGYARSFSDDMTNNNESNYGRDKDGEKMITYNDPERVKGSTDDTLNGDGSDGQQGLDLAASEDSGSFSHHIDNDGSSPQLDDTMLRESSLIISALESSKLESAPRVSSSGDSDWIRNESEDFGNSNFKSDESVDKSTFGNGGYSFHKNTFERSNANVKNTFGNCSDGKSFSDKDISNSSQKNNNNGNGNLYEKRTNRFSMRSDSNDSMFFMAQTSFSGPTEQPTTVIVNDDVVNSSKISGIKKRWPPASNVDKENINPTSSRSGDDILSTDNRRWSTASPDTERGHLKQSHIDIKLKRTTSSTSSGEGLRMNNRFARGPSPTLAAVPRGRVSSIKYSFEGTVRKSKSVSNLSSTSKKNNRFNGGGFSDDEDDDDDAFAVGKRPTLRSAASFGHINTNNLSPLLNDRRFFQNAISSASPSSAFSKNKTNNNTTAQRAVSFSNISSNAQREQDLDDLIDDYERENFPVSVSVAGKERDTLVVSPSSIGAGLDDIDFPPRERLGTTGEIAKRTKVDVLTNNNETYRVVRQADDSDSDDEARAAAVRRRLGIDDGAVTTSPAPLSDSDV